MDFNKTMWISRQGKVTIPARIRRAMGWVTGTDLDFIPEGDDAVRLVVAKPEKPQATKGRKPNRLARRK